MSRRVRISLLTIGGCLLIGGTLLFFYHDEILAGLNPDSKVWVWNFTPHRIENAWPLTAATVTFNPSRPVIDISHKVKKRCKETLQWTMFDEDVLLRIYYPRSMEDIALKMKPYINSAYLQIEHRTGCRPPGLEAYIYPLPMSFSFRRVNYSAQIPCPEGFVSIIFLFGNIKKSATDSELFKKRIRSLTHEIGHIILHRKYRLYGIGSHATRWFDEGFAQYLSDVVIMDIGLLGPLLEPTSAMLCDNVIQRLEDPRVQHELHKWQLTIVGPALSLIGDADAIDEYLDREMKLYKASHDVMLAMETIGGEGTIKSIFKTITAREEKTLNSDELFEIVNSHLGFDIRDWDKLLNAYKQKTEQVVDKNNK